MFKLVVLSALFAAAAAEPGVFFSPATYAAVVPAPATTTYVQQSSSYVAPAPLYTALPYPHYIKKRSAPFFNTYVAPSTYIAGAPLAAPYASTYIAPSPLAASYSSPLLPTYAATTHFIKKRSVPLLAAPASYIAPAPFTSTYLAPSPLTSYSTAILPGAPIVPAYADIPFIKK